MFRICRIIREINFINTFQIHHLKPMQTNYSLQQTCANEKLKSTYMSASISFWKNFLLKFDVILPGHLWGHCHGEGYWHRWRCVISLVKCYTTERLKKSDAGDFLIVIFNNYFFLIDSPIFLQIFLCFQFFLAGKWVDKATIGQIITN